MNCPVTVTPEIKSLFFTGHRPFPGQLDIAHPQRQEIRKHLSDVLYRAHLFGKFNTFYTGMAQGFDMDAALTVISMKQDLKGGVFLVAAIPFKYHTVGWSDKTMWAYREILEQCDQIVHVSPPGYDKRKYQLRNMWMVDQCLEGICLWKGGDGGTRNTIKYALRKGKRVINLLQKDVREAL